MIYKVIGLMSGSSLDGLDIAYVHLEEIRGQWSFDLKCAACIPYAPSWKAKLKEALNLPVTEFLQLHTAYGHYLGAQVNAFIAGNNLEHKVDFIASHGHTVYHNPAQKTTCQIGDGAAILAETILPVISDLRATDVALGGQGAPIVPVGDQLLFTGYDYLLNIGGIANLTVKQPDGSLLAFDVCPANQVLNQLSEKLGKAFDEQGGIAASGALLPATLEAMHAHDYYALPAPKSLDNAVALGMLQPMLDEAAAVPDLLHTVSVHIAQQIAAAIKKHSIAKEEAKMLITGGGAFHSFLTNRLKVELPGVEITIPEPDIIQYKEAIVMALIGALRWREEENMFASVTGASRNSIGGALWMR